MRDLFEYSDSTPDYELFGFFYERIISGEIRTFSALRKFAGTLIGNQRCRPVILQAFELIKRLNWGFFSSLSPYRHQKLWKELVIPDKNFAEAGDMKHTLQISNLYIAMLDIHGYTKFCMDSRKNLSMMHVLDRVIEYEIGRICTACGAVSRRERGDEMVVIAASATDAMTATLSIIDYFNKTNVVSDPNIFTGRTGEAANLPNFKISAGITGGNTTSPLIMTERGYLSGFLLNSGARLQVRANELSPMESRVMIAKQVQMNFLKENTQTKCALVRNNAVSFFDTGHIEFKGVIIPTFEVIFDENDRYKESLNTEIIRLFEAIRDNLWEQRVFTDLVDLIAKTVAVMPKFSVQPPVPIEGIQLVTNDSLLNLCKKAKFAYLDHEDYGFAIMLLQKFIEIIEMVPFFDRLIMEYLQGISEKYVMLLDLYNQSIDQQVDANSSVIYQGKYFHAWEAAKKGVSMYEKFREMGRTSSLIAKKKSLWYGLIQQKKSEMVFTLYSGKK